MFGWMDDSWKPELVSLSLSLSLSLSHDAGAEAAAAAGKQEDSPITEDVAK